MEVWVFLVAAFVSLPKQIAAVYLGTGTVDANGNSEHSLVLSAAPSLFPFLSPFLFSLQPGVASY